MKGLVTALMLLFGGIGPGEDTLRVLFWNVENFFDYRDEGYSDSDAEFSSRGERRWTKRRFQAKCDAVAKALLWTASEEGGLPDAVGLAEVENAFVLRRLLKSTSLRKLDYKYLHFESPDPRGIDVALLYRERRLQLLEARPCHLYAPDSSILATRDILLARFRAPDGEEIAFLVNHHPSKYGGAAVSEPRRKVAVKRLRALADSLAGLGVARIVAMGDFNDTPDNPLFGLLEPTLQPLHQEFYRHGQGTIKYEGKWDLIDHFYVSETLVGSAEMKILHIPFLLVREASHPGEKPLRTYQGPRYLGGVSDHCPIWLRIIDKSEGLRIPF